jgi:hypothetical protein
MPRAASSRLSQPIFHEPFFNEDKPTPDPTGFETKHQSDTKTYKEVEDLLKKNVVPIPPSRMADDDVFGLADAYGNHGPEIVAKIKKAGKIIFHCCGDSGASNARKYANDFALPIKSRSIAPKRIRIIGRRSSIISAMSSIVSGKRNTITISFMNHSAPIPRQFWPFPAITTLSSFQALQKPGCR